MYLKNEYDEKDGGMLFSVLIGAVIAATFLMQIIIEVIAFSTNAEYEDITKNSVISWIIQGTLYAVLLGAVILYHKSKKINFIKANGLDKKFTVTDIIMSIVLGIGMLFSFLIITFLYSYFLQEIGYKNDSGFFEINNFGVFLAAVLILCVLPSVVEETVFRGAVLRGYSKVFPAIWAAVISALFFMLMHMNLSQVVNPLLTGIVTAVLVQKTKTLKISLITHFTNNFVLVLITYIQSSETESEILVLDKKTIIAYLIYFAIGAILLAATLIYFLKFRKEATEETTVKESNTVFENEEEFSVDRTVAVPENLRDRKMRALLYASFGIIACVAVIVTSLFLSS